MEENDLLKVKIITLSDESLKDLGELLRNETSRKIILALAEEGMIINQIAEKTNLSVSLVINYMKKLKRLGLVDITQKKIRKKTKKHNYYKINTDIFLSITNEPQENKLKRIFKEGVKFAVISLIAFSVWLFPIDSQLHASTGNEYFYKDKMIYTLLIIIVGLIAERFWFWKKRKKG